MVPASVPAEIDVILRYRGLQFEQERMSSPVVDMMYSPTLRSLARSPATTTEEASQLTIRKSSLYALAMIAGDGTSLGLLEGALDGAFDGVPEG